MAWITRYWRRPYSETALRTGLPLPEKVLTPELFVRAASRAGFSARRVRRSLERISPLVLPAVLLLNDRQACVLVAINRKLGKGEVVWPESGGGSSEVYLSDLADRYAGSAFFIRPDFRFDARSAEIPDPSSGGWFWGT